MIDIKTLKELIKLMVANDLTEMDLEGEGDKVKLKRGHGEGAVHYVSPPVANYAPPAPATGSAAAGGAAAGGDGKRAEAQEGVTIASPMVGTFYASPSPDAKAYVNVGDAVNPDSVVCIIEAMKVFNEIKAETSGTILKMLVASGQSVEFGQPLFLVKPN